MNRGNLFIISGPSGAGKGTICNHFLNDDDVYLSVSVTTRNKRNEEIEGVTYFYDTVEGFERRIQDGKMLEWAKYGDNYYGTPKDIVEEKLNNGINVILEIEVQGAFKVKEQMNDAVMIFIVPPSMKELYQRLLDRGRESIGEINKRIDIAKGELKKAIYYDHIVVNDNLKDSVKKVRNIIDERKEKTNLISRLIEELE
ncbi:MAG: guanylate kinase [Clostridia bacterium]|nr:guanylate kinase [Clostridia bacterium]